MQFIKFQEIVMLQSYMSKLQGQHKEIQQNTYINIEENNILVPQKFPEVTCWS